MRVLKPSLLALLIGGFLCAAFVHSTGGQSNEQQTQYDQAWQAAQAGDHVRAYAAVERLTRRDSLFYQARLLRIALAARLKKTGPEIPQNLLRVLKGDAPWARIPNVT